MRIPKTSTPVVVIECLLGGLAIMRSLGPHGISLVGIDADRWAPGRLSRYCRAGVSLRLAQDRKPEFLEQLLRVGRRLGQPALLIPTSDETSEFVAEHAAALDGPFLFPKVPAKIVTQLASKKEMYGLARRHGIPTPHTIFPSTLDEVRSYAAQATYPVMLKGIYGNRLQSRNHKKMVIVRSPEELISHYRRMEDPEVPNLMLQEYIPGGDDQIYIFNGYFNHQSECVLGMTGRKLRQFRIHTGCASLGECRWYPDVAKLTTELMKAVGYRGILDIGYRFDARDGQYKVLDINPRVGQAYRLFVTEDDCDVVKALYLDLTGQPVCSGRPREGRRWLIEDFDAISSYHYWREGTLTPGQWLRSFRGVEEAAWFSWKDPVPFLVMAAGFMKKMLTWSLKHAGLSRTKGSGDTH
ncbi:MAG: hypothetical protein AB1515_00285 [Nitrospirota bacterium]